MRKKAKRIFFTIVAILSILIGILGVFLPILDGIIFIIIGIVILSIEFSSVDDFIIKRLTKHDKIKAFYNKMRGFLEKYFG